MEQSPGEHGVGIFETPWRRTIHRLPHRCGGTQTKGTQSELRCLLTDILD